MLNFDLADLYEVEIRVLNQGVNRNSGRFPGDFMFRLTKPEYEEIEIQIEALESSNPLTSQNVILKPGRGQHRKIMPYAFTEQGVAMLVGCLHSSKAIQMIISIIRAFVEIGRLLIQQSD